MTHARSLLLASLLLAVPLRAPAAPNLVLVSLDTTRGDHLGFGGSPVPSSPTLDRIARSSYVFCAAKSVIPLTGPAHATVMTGLYPHAHGAIRNTNLLRQDVPTLADVLHHDGYQTAAFVSGWTLRAQLSGVDRGFEVYDQEMPDHYKLINTQRHADQTLDQALAWLAGRFPARPFFLFIHLFDAHDPYVEHAPWSADFEASYWGLRRNEKFARKLAAYDSEIAFMDRQIGRLLDALERRGLLQSSWLVVMGDHGEAFGEHGATRHGRRVHEPALNIPLMLRPPGGLPRQHLIGQRVSLVDLMPSFLELLGQRPVPAQGTSLVPLLEGRPSIPRPPVRFEAYTLWSLRRKKLPSKLGVFVGPFKVVLSPRNGKFEVYDLARDPGERHNIASQHPELEHYRRELLDWWRASRTQIEEPKLSAEDLERLRQLGYVN
jgi:arylsulfatase A-like enzyme